MLWWYEEINSTLTTRTDGTGHCHQRYKVLRLILHRSKQLNISRTMANVTKQQITIHVPQNKITIGKKVQSWKQRYQ